jgi:hypothetical protein
MSCALLVTGARRAILIHGMDRGAILTHGARTANTLQRSAKSGSIKLQVAFLEVECNRASYLCS